MDENNDFSSEYAGKRRFCAGSAKVEEISQTKHGAAALPTFVVYNAPRQSVKKLLHLEGSEIAVRNTGCRQGRTSPVSLPRPMSMQNR